MKHLPSPLCNLGILLAQAICSVPDDQGDHLSGKQGNVREFILNQGNVKKKNFVGKLPHNFPKNCINSIFNVIHLVLYANFYVFHC